MNRRAILALLGGSLVFGASPPIPAAPEPGSLAWLAQAIESGIGAEACPMMLTIPISRETWDYYMTEYLDLGEWD